MYIFYIHVTRGHSIMARKKSTAAAALSMERSALVLQGFLAILFGITAVFWPGLTTISLMYILAIFLLADGLVALVFGLINLKEAKHGLLMALLGVLEIALSIYLINNPEVAFATFILLLGLVFIGRGIFSFAHIFTRGGSALGKTLQGVAGIIGIIVGIFVLTQPVAGGLAFVWIVGLYALITGPMLIALSADLGGTRK